MKHIFEHHALGWIGAFLVLFGYYLNAHMNEYCWLTWLVGNGMVGFYCVEKRAYPTAAMSFALVAMNIYGYINWVS